TCVSCFFSGTAYTPIPTLSLHDALPISRRAVRAGDAVQRQWVLDVLVHRHVANQVEALEDEPDVEVAHARPRRRAHLPELQPDRSEEHTSALQSLAYPVCRLLLEPKQLQ